MGLAISSSIVEAHGGRHLGHPERRPGCHASGRDSVGSSRHSRVL